MKLELDGTYLILCKDREDLLPELKEIIKKAGFNVLINWHFLFNRNTYYYDSILLHKKCMFARNGTNHVCDIKPIVLNVTDLVKITNWKNEMKQ